VSRRARAVARCALLALAFAALGAGAQDRISEAETLLFLTDHLKGVVPPATLSYEFRKSGTAEAGFDDTVQVRVRTAGDGGKVVSVAFFTRGRKIDLPDVTKPEGNPVLLYFLEHDIREMERITGGKSGYFRKAIRLALARSATVAKTTISFGGRDFAAQEITITPYADDPLKDRIGRYATKTYVFTLSTHVPGGIYSVRTVVPAPAAAAKAAPLIEEHLRFVRSSR
jgi:hypothetical protein